MNQLPAIFDDSSYPVLSTSVTFLQDSVRASLVSFNALGFLVNILPIPKYLSTENIPTILPKATEAAALSEAPFSFNWLYTSVFAVIDI